MTTEVRDAKSFLFTTWEGGGNLPPVLSVARSLRAAGHEVRIMSDEVNRAEALATGARFVPWTEAPSRRDKSASSEFIRDWAAPTPQEGLVCVIDRVMCGPALAYARDVLAELARERADAIVNCELLAGPMVAAEVADIPFALLCPNVSLLPLPDVPPMGPGLLPARSAEERALHAEIAAANEALFDRGLPALNAARAALGLAPLAHVADQIHAAAGVFLATARAFDFAPAALPAGMSYVAPQLDDPASEETWQSPWPASDTRPLVLISFSTTFQNQGAALQRALEAASVLPARVLVTVGPALDVARFTIGDNTRLVARAPHAAVMAEAAAVCCHGGHGTVIRALASGCPLLVLPMGRDQNDNAARVVAKGAGLSLSQDSGVAEIRAALQRLLDEPGFTEGAERLRRAIHAEIAASPILGLLEVVTERREAAICAA